MVLKRVGLTGASGMLGRHLIELLEEKRILISASSLDKPNNLPDNSIWIEWDLAQWKSLAEIDKIFPDIDAFVHIGAAVGAGISRKTVFDVNVRSCLNTSEWAMERGIPYLYISGATVYAEPERSNIWEDDPKAVSGFAGFYGYSKYLGEQVLSHMASLGLKLCILRPSSIYGFGLPVNKMISSFLNTAALGQVIQLKPPVEDRIDMIHARDVAIAIMQAIENEAYGIFNIASETPVSIYEIAQTCVEVVGRGGVEVGANESCQEPGIRFGLQCEAARHAFAYHPTLTLKEGLAKMWQDTEQSDHR